MEENLYTVKLIADKKGNLRQAGTVDPVGDLLKEIRKKAETDLYYFCVFVLGRDYLHEELHYPVCKWLTEVPPIRKLLLLPRNHAKTSIVSHGLPMHILIQSQENNIYWSGIAGCNMKILLAGEVEKRAVENLGTVKLVFEQNITFRGLWPHICWENPRRQAPAWNNTSLVIPRNVHFPDPTIRAVGAGGAITGTRPHVAIKDDIVSEEAANSPQVMENAISWHKNTRALYESQDHTLEYIIGTRWAVKDLYSHIIENDPTVEPMIRSAIEDGKVIYPQKGSDGFTFKSLEQERLTNKTMFPLLYMNNVGDPDLVDFPEEELRFFKRMGKVLSFSDDIRDTTLEKKVGGSLELPKRGMSVYDAMSIYGENRDQYYFHR